MVNELNKRILFIIGNLRVSNGVTSVIMNHYDKLIKAGYKVDFCAMYNWGSIYIKTVLDNGGKFYILPQEDVKDEVETSGIRIEEDRSGKPDKKRAYEFVKKIIENGNYGIVHIHIIGYYALIASQIAKKCNVPIRIFHSHNPIHIHNLHSLLFTLFYNVQCVHNCNRYLACSNLAGKSMFRHRKFNVIRNTIDTNSIYYSEQKRNELRKELSIRENDFVYGTVCRQTYQKNPYFLIDVFEQIALRKENAKFVWPADHRLGSRRGGDGARKDQFRVVFQEDHLAGLRRLCVGHPGDPARTPAGRALTGSGNGITGAGAMPPRPLYIKIRPAGRVSPTYVSGLWP